MSVARPLVLLLLLAIPFWWWYRRRRRVSVPFSDVRMAGEVGKPPWWTALPPILRSLGLAALIIAAAGPQVGGSTVEEKREGIAIVIAVDISSSMLAEDFAPSNRLEVAKQEAIGFIRGRKADRIGLVAFAGEALTQVPVTLDYPVVEQAVSSLRIGSLEDGTAIGSGLATAVNRLRRAPGKSKVVLLLTDGENNRGRIDPRTAAMAGCCNCASCAPSHAPEAAAREMRPSSSSTASASSATAQASGLPPKVLPCDPGSKSPSTSRRPTTADTG